METADTKIMRQELNVLSVNIKGVMGKVENLTKKIMKNPPLKKRKVTFFVQFVES